MSTSKRDPRFRVNPVQPVPKPLDIDVGDLVFLVEDEKGNIALKSTKISNADILAGYHINRECFTIRDAQGL